MNILSVGTNRIVSQSMGGFILHLLPEYEQQIAQKKKSAAEIKKRQQEMKELTDEIQRQDFMKEKYNQLPKHHRSMVMTKAVEMLENDIATENMKLTDTLRKFILDANIITIMENEYNSTL